MKSLPDSCPDCGFVWGEFQGDNYGNGYRVLAARVWQCTRCAYILEVPDPRNRKLHIGSESASLRT